MRGFEKRPLEQATIKQIHKDAITQAIAFDLEWSDSGGISKRIPSSDVQINAEDDAEMRHLLLEYSKLHADMGAIPNCQAVQKAKGKGKQSAPQSRLKPAQIPTPAVPQEYVMKGITWNSEARVELSPFALNEPLLIWWSDAFESVWHFARVHRLQPHDPIHPVALTFSSDGTICDNYPCTPENQGKTTGEYSWVRLHQKRAPTVHSPNIRRSTTLRSHIVRCAVLEARETMRDGNRVRVRGAL